MKISDHCFSLHASLCSRRFVSSGFRWFDHARSLFGVLVETVTVSRVIKSSYGVKLSPFSRSGKTSNLFPNQLLCFSVDLLVQEDVTERGHKSLLTLRLAVYLHALAPSEETGKRLNRE